MGQGAESVPGYDDWYDGLGERSETLASGYWEQKNGQQIKMSDMSTSHLYNAIRHCEQHIQCAQDEHDAGTWAEMANMLRSELWGRNRSTTTKKVKKATSKPKTAKPQRGAKQMMQCHCGTVYEVRVSELKRGNGKSCSKRCAAIRRDYGRPAAKEVK